MWKPCWIDPILNIIAPNRRAKKKFWLIKQAKSRFEGLHDVATSWRSCVMGPPMPLFYSLVHISHITGLFGVNRAKKVQKTRFLRKYDVITSWRSYVTKIVSCLHMSVYYMHRFWRFEGNRREYKPPRAIFRGDLIDFAAKFANVFEP